jgi:hypothetical protein
MGFLIYTVLSSPHAAAIHRFVPQAHDLSKRVLMC